MPGKPKLMWKDPIVEEIHPVRRRIARECDYDITRIMDLLRKSEAEHPEGLYTEPLGE